MRVRYISFLFSLMACFTFLTAPVQAQDGGATAPVSLASYPSGGAGLADAVAKALAADIGVLDEIVAMLAEANPAQQAAIGAGLGRAAKYYDSLAKVAIDDQAKEAAVAKAELIAKAVAETKIPVVMASFALGTGDTPAAIPAGGGARATGGGALGGGVGRSAARTDGSDDNGSRVTTSSTNYFSSGGGGSYTGGGGSSSVSPTS